MEKIFQNLSGEKNSARTFVLASISFRNCVPSPANSSPQWAPTKTRALSAPAACHLVPSGHSSSGVPVSWELSRLSLFVTVRFVRWLDLRCYVSGQKRLSVRMGQSAPPLILTLRPWSPQLASPAADVEILWEQVSSTPLLDVLSAPSCRPKGEIKGLNYLGRGGRKPDVSSQP